MRKASWVAVAAGAVLLVAGCSAGSEGGAPHEAAPGKGGGAAGGGGLSAAAVKKEIETAATAAGFTQDATGDAVPAGLENCMVSWTPDTEKAVNPKKSYTDTLDALGKGGWKEGQGVDQGESRFVPLTKSQWKLKASEHTMGEFKMVLFIASDTTPACEELFKADLEKEKAKNKKS
ncbi:hypothetical protein [Streptomyces showdoensis]|uniref:Lipoprotein n=1 Tax=Streptomyces showdoensis TaxID=68268 RepID=A0A2P2GTW2_STREW|nr:hypothetical protein [Streptomyces showdoensis]KKZ74922.1 hypothetical protein VO63_05645 [Streptomyces showdoensis]